MSPRVAGAPISWGVCEVPGWGWQYTAEPVLAEMAELGLGATEFGPDGFLPQAMADKVALLNSYGLRAVGQFLAIVMHEPQSDPTTEVRMALPALVSADAELVIIAAATGVDGYDTRPALDDAGWQELLTNLDRIDHLVSDAGLVAAVHPHIGTMIENAAETERVLAGSRIGLCLDTGHLTIGGADPVDLARRYADRIKHLHLKDVRTDLAERVRRGELSYTDAVRQGMYAPLGEGDIDFASLLASTSEVGYSGWYVLEQDTVLTDEPGPEHSPRKDVATSLRHLHELMGA